MNWTLSPGTIFRCDWAPVFVFAEGCARPYALMDEYILPGVNRKVGRPGMAMWSILVLAVVSKALRRWLHEHGEPAHGYTPVSA